LRIAKWFSLVPVLPAALLADIDIEIVASRDIRVPVYSEESTADARMLSKLRASVRDVVVCREKVRQERFVECVRALDELLRAMPGDSDMQVRIALLKFDYQPMTGGRGTRPSHPVILVPATASPPAVA